MIIRIRLQHPGYKYSNIEARVTANYHTHMYLCHHAEGDSSDYAKVASENTFIQTLGMSDHGPIPISYIRKITDENREELMKKNEGYSASRMNYNQFLTVYKDSIKKANELYSSVKTLTSVEIEYITGHLDYYEKLRKECDYLLLGQHFFYDEVTDETPDSNQINSGNVIRYAKSIEEALNTGLFKIVAHPDIFMAHYKSSDGVLRKFDENAKAASRIIIEAAIKNNCYLEYNANGAYRGKYSNGEGSYDYTYPRKEFFELAKSYKDAKFVLGLDTHLPKRLGSNNVSLCLRNIIELGLNCENVEIINKNK